MRKVLTTAALCLFMAACTKQNGTSGQGSSAENQAGSSLKQTENQIEQTADQAKNRVKDAANAQAKSIDAQADAAKARIEADKAKADAAMKQQEKNVDQASQKIQNAVGSAQQSVSGNQTDDNQLLNEAKAQVQNDTNVNVTVDNGVVTLNGTVNSDQEKTSLENRVKQVRGVQDVKNNLDVKSQ